MPLLPLHGHAALRARFNDAIRRDALPGSLLLHGPLAVGMKASETLHDALGATTPLQFPLVTEKPAPLIAALMPLSAEPPMLVKVTVALEVPPTDVVAKPTLPTEATSWEIVVTSTLR